MKHDRKRDRRSSLVRLNVELRKVGTEQLPWIGEIKIEEPVATGSMTMDANEAFKRFEFLFRPRSADPRKNAEGEFRVKCSNQQIPRNLPPTDWKRIRFHLTQVNRPRSRRRRGLFRRHQAPRRRQGTSRPAARELRRHVHPVHREGETGQVCKTVTAIPSTFMALRPEDDVSRQPPAGGRA